MAYCSQCGAEISADAKQCPNCNAVIGVSAAAIVVNQFDHTAEFDATDISENKVYALIAYLVDFFGLIPALMVAKDSPYAKFHARESAKLSVATYLVAILTCCLMWTCIVPIAGIILLLILVVVKIICIVQVCKGKAVEPWLIRSLKFLH